MQDRSANEDPRGPGEHGDVLDQARRVARVAELAFCWSEEEWETGLVEAVLRPQRQNPDADTSGAPRP